MTNFDFLKKNTQFDSFSDVAVSAEKNITYGHRGQRFKLSSCHGVRR